MYSKIALRARARLGHACRWMSSHFRVEKKLSATALMLRRARWPYSATLRCRTIKEAAQR